MNIAVIGGGNMGEAIIAGVLRGGEVHAGSITVGEASQARREVLVQKHKVTALAENEAAVKGADVVILAVKPQSLEEAMKAMKGAMISEQLVLSIVAGARIETISRGLGHKAVVRVMPNTPAQIGEGVSVWTATSAVSPAQKHMARAILAALGKEYYVPSEDYVDMATALSGSGPAYVFLVIEALTDAGVHLGLSRELASDLVLQTIIGSARFVQLSGKHPAELRNMVTSPRGTTAEGLLKLEEGGLRALLDQAVMAGYRRAKELGGPQ